MGKKWLSFKPEQKKIKYKWRRAVGKRNLREYSVWGSAAEAAEKKGKRKKERTSGKKSAEALGKFGKGSLRGSSLLRYGSEGAVGGITSAKKPTGRLSLILDR